MNENFHKTVNLRGPEASRENDLKKSALLEKIYRGRETTEGELTKISRPAAARINESFLKRIIFFLALVIVGAVIYWLFFQGKSGEQAREAGKEKWYAVKLVSGEVFYGQINKTKDDPIELNNVYYDYDQNQEKGGEQKSAETGNLRLVKRGKETHGPSGLMEIFHSQILFMEPLQAESKVLKAILEYEK